MLGYNLKIAAIL